MILQIHRVLPSPTTPGVCSDGHWMATLHSQVGALPGRISRTCGFGAGGDAGSGAYAPWRVNRDGNQWVDSVAGLQPETIPGSMPQLRDMLRRTRENRSLQPSFDVFFLDQSFDGKMGFDKSFDMTSTKVWGRLPRATGPVFCLLAFPNSAASFWVAQGYLRGFISW